MLPFEHLLPFFIATALFALTPGPGMIYMSLQTMARGEKAGWLSALAFHLASYVHILAAAFGVTLILQTVPVLFTALKLAGAAYLIWMGLMLIGSGGDGQAASRSQPPKTARQAFRDSLTVELLNPKTALFYFAFLPSFASAEAAAPVWMQIVILGTLANLTFSLTDALCIRFSSLMASWAHARRNLARGTRRLGGGLFILLGTYIAFSKD